MAQKDSIKLRLPQTQKEWLVLVIAIIITLVTLGWDGIDAWFKPNQQSVSSEVVQRFNGENFDIFDALTEIPVQYIRSVDGDTVMLSLNGHSFRARYLMINTPEIGDSPQPYALEAKQRNHELLSKAREVTMTFDKGDKADHYNRALVYLYVDGHSVSEILLAEGLASLDYVYPPNNSYESVFEQKEKAAQAQHLNIWSDKR